MEDSPSTLQSEVEECRERLREDLERVKSAVDPRDIVRDTIRKYPLASLGAGALTGAVVASALMPHGRRSPLGAMIGGALAMAYRGFFMAATPIFAARVAEALIPSLKHSSPPVVLEAESLSTGSADAESLRTRP